MDIKVSFKCDVCDTEKVFNVPTDNYQVTMVYIEELFRTREITNGQVKYTCSSECFHKGVNEIFPSDDTWIDRNSDAYMRGIARGVRKVIGKV